MPRLLEPPMLKTFTTSRREYILIAAIVLATVAALFIPFAWDTAATVQNLKSRGLTPSTNPIDTTSAPVVFAAIACILLLATSGLLLTLPCAAARRIATVGAGAETVILLGLGAASFVSAYTLPPNTDALVGLALLVISSPLLAGGIAYLGVTLLIRSKSPGWRVVAAIVDSVLAWMIALLALHEALDAAVPFWAGTVRNPIYNPALYGTWPLVEAGLLALVVLAGAVAVDVYAVRARKPAACGAQHQRPVGIDGQSRGADQALSRVLPSPADRHGRFHPLTELVEWLGSGRMIRFWPNHLLSIRPRRHPRVQIPLP